MPQPTSLSCALTASSLRHTKPSSGGLYLLPSTGRELFASKWMRAQMLETEVAGLTSRSSSSGDVGKCGRRKRALRGRLRERLGLSAGPAARPKSLPTAEV